MDIPKSPSPPIKRCFDAKISTACEKREMKSNADRKKAKRATFDFKIYCKFSGTIYCSIGERTEEENHHNPEIKYRTLIFDSFGLQIFSSLVEGNFA